MIFMGEEWGASTPWAFFTSHPEPELAERCGRGGWRSSPQMDWEPSAVPDPQDPTTFAASKLDWSELDQPRHADLFALHARLIELRQQYPDFTDPRFDQGRGSLRRRCRLAAARPRGHGHRRQLLRPAVPVDLGRAVESVLALGAAELDADRSSSARTAPSSAKPSPPNRPAERSIRVR